MKTCKTCGIEKNLDCFRNKQSPNGKWYRRNTCKSCLLDQDKKYTRKKKPYRHKPSYLKHHLTKQQYDALYEAQNGLCANPACGSPATDIDHDHACCAKPASCGKCVTGILCHNCNCAEGQLQSNAAKALGLAEYILMSRKTPEDESTFFIMDHDLVDRMRVNKV